MRLLRPITKAMLATLLIRPLTRRLRSRPGQALTEELHTTIDEGAEAIWHTAVADMSALIEPGGVDASDEDAIDSDGRSRIKLIAIAAVAIVAVALIATVIASIVKPRHEAEVFDLEESVPEPVAIEVETAAETETEEDSARDELREIRGIGNETAKNLRELGVTSIEQIAEWEPQDIQTMAQGLELSPERIEQEDWVGQAKELIAPEAAAVAE
jgi:predicted flap endonuclease-1-like 5' DNA nuclease